ncbi:substrate-binding domain-containing protein [Nesterenkonia pannonica]|nr:substrate-binding domain-containing protein [Nesterenkonia pannonica]
MPEQVAVIGYDDSEVARLARPPLTTVEGALRAWRTMRWRCCPI